jgi:hypothetical protein
MTNFDLEDTRCDLIALREAHGARTPIGFIASNLIQQLEALQTAEGEQRAHLLANIQDGMAALGGPWRLLYFTMPNYR